MAEATPRPASLAQAPRYVHSDQSSSAHNSKGTAPARLSKEVQDEVESLREPVPYGRLQVLPARGLKRPVNEQRLARGEPAWDKTPEAAVPTVLTIVAHGEKAVRRNDQFAALNVVRQRRSPVGCRAAQVIRT